MSAICLDLLGAVSVLKSLKTSDIVKQNSLEEIERLKSRSKSVQTLVRTVGEAGQSTEPENTIQDGIETEVELHPGADDFRREDSSDEEDSQASVGRRSGRLIVERTFDDGSAGTRTIREQPADQIMQEIGDNPKLWDMVKRMVNKAKGGEPSTPRYMRQNNIVASIKSPSDTTIYSPALKKKRFDRNSERDIHEQLSDDMFDKISNYIERVRLETSSKANQDDQQSDVDQGQPEGEFESEPEQLEADDPQRQRTKAKELNEQMIISAEKNKAMITAPRGETVNRVPSKPIIDSAQIDNKYFLSTCHLDEALKQKIRNGEFVELEKLLPRQVKYKHEDERIDIVSREGKSFFMQKYDRDACISGIKKWDEAFRIYMAVYTEANPTRGAELVQYMHNIHTAYSAYHWDNIMFYDYSFRRMMHDYPERNWGITNMQMWSLAMKNPINLKPNNHFTGGGSGSGGAGVAPAKKKHNDWRDNVCWKFNRNKCNRGANCRFEHRCSFCGSTQHIYFGCPKRGKNPSTPDQKRHDKPADEASQVATAQN